MQPTEPQSQLRTLVVSAPGIMGESLRAMLASFPRITIVGSAAGCLSARNMARDLAPDLVVIDANLPEPEVLTLLEELNNGPSSPRAVIFINTTSQKKRALAAGADAALWRSDPSQLLVDTLFQFHAERQPAYGE